jgi:signal transduction histidine kinase
MNHPADATHQAPDFLTAPGEVGAQILAHDWSHTPLGPIAQWPQSLKTVVSLMLSSRQPMWVGWGEQATFLYNDAYIDVLSMAKHPWALGRPAAEVWAEIWDICGPLSDRVFRLGEATLANDVRLFMSRGDFLEEVFYSFSYSPVRDESGKVAGLFCPNLDVTAKHLNARRLLTLSELSAGTRDDKTVAGACDSIMRSLGGNPDDVPFALLYLAGEGDGDGDGDGDRADVTLVRATHADIAPGLFAADAVLHAGRAREVDLPADAATLPAGLAGQPLRSAIMLPLTGSGEQALGVLVLGVSAARRLDADYRRFMELVAMQTGAAIQHARSAEDERLRADMLAELDRAKTHFFSNVSHEFRTPLTLMLGPMEDALDDQEEPLPPRQRGRMALMRRNGLRLQKLVNTLLEFSRVQAGRTHAQFVPVDLAALTADLASSFRSAIEGAGMRLLVDCPPLPAPVYVDPALWEKIVLNLISNAFKFTFTGHIAVSLEVVGHHVYLAVSDTGTGIPDDQLPHLFERFHRVEGARSRTHEGSGIGLALVHDLVALHGGRIGVESAVGEGTVFRVEVALGYAHLDPDQVAHAASEPPRLTAAPSYVAEAEGWVQHADVLAAGSAVSTRRGRLLIADDNADMRDYLCRLLSDHWHVDLCRNGVEALAAVARQLPDVILSDVMMPELDGFGLLAALRGQSATRDVAVMLLSARAGEEARLEGLQAGADDYLVKPFSGRELVARLDVLRERRQARLVESTVARRTQSIFSQAPVAIAILRGPLHVFEQANGYYQALVGPRPLDGLTIRAAFPELEGQGVFELLDGVLATGQPYIARAMTLKLSSGPEGQLAERSFDFVYQPLLGDDGRPEGVAVVVFEVTELANARRAAEAANRAKDEFLAMLGHELRNPLAPIVTALQLMRLRGGDHALKERAVIERQTSHLVALVDDLLDVSRVAEGKIQLRRQPVEIADVVARAIETASPLIEQKRHVLEVDVPATGLAVLADVGRCVQVVANLLNNAAKYTEAGGTLKVTAWRDGESVMVAVRDNGIGIDRAMLDLIFERFVQERQALSRSQGGLGLGLTIARSMVVLHGGSIAVHSDGAGQGSTFTVRLPLLASALHQPDEAPAVAPPVASLATAPAAGLRIMVVDDNEDAACALGELLTLHGHTVHVAFGAPEALRQEPLFQPQVCLLDIGLPGMDGYELAQRLRQHSGGRALGLVAITGYGQDSDRRRATDAGFDHHLTKPVDLAALAALLDQRLARQIEG